MNTLKPKWMCSLYMPLINMDDCYLGGRITDPQPLTRIIFLLKMEAGKSGLGRINSCGLKWVSTGEEGKDEQWQQEAVGRCSGKKRRQGREGWASERLRDGGLPQELLVCACLSPSLFSLTSPSVFSFHSFPLLFRKSYFYQFAQWRKEFSVIPAGKLVTNFFVLNNAIWV